MPISPLPIGHSIKGDKLLDYDDNSHCIRDATWE